MKDQYFGDINDYRKYGLLRCLNEAGLSIGVCWMLTASDLRPDGLRTAYLNQPDRFRHHDPALFDCLREAIAGGHRSVSIVEQANLLQPARFAPSLLGSSRSHRVSYFSRAVAQLEESQFVFLDPDNGLEVKSTPYGTKDSEKYLYWSELEPFWNKGSSLLIYQHFRREARPLFSERMGMALLERTGAPFVAAISTSHVVFFLAGQTQHAGLLMTGLDLTQRKWAGQLEVALLSELRTA